MNNQNYGVIGNCRTSTLVSQILLSAKTQKGINIPPEAL